MSLLITAAFEIGSEPAPLEITSSNGKIYKKLQYDVTPLITELDPIYQGKEEIIGDGDFYCTLFIDENEYNAPLTTEAVVYGTFAMALDMYHNGVIQTARWVLSPIEYKVINKTEDTSFTPLIYGSCKSVWPPTLRTTKGGKEFLSVNLQTQVHQKLLGCVTPECTKVALQSMWWRVSDLDKLNKVPATFTGVLTGFSFYRNKDGMAAGNVKIRLLELEPLVPFGYTPEASDNYNDNTKQRKQSGSDMFNRGKKNKQQVTKFPDPSELESSETAFPDPSDLIVDIDDLNP